MATAMAHRIPRRFRATAETFVSGSSVRYLRDGEEAFPAMLAAIAAAREQILLEMYWFASDRIGRRFAAALAERASTGVQVAILYDSVGSISASPAMFDELRAAGAMVHEFNPVAPWAHRFRLDRLGLRDHRKMLVIDGATGFTGGLNIGDPWLGVGEGGGGWRDDVVALDGPAVEAMRLLFERTWIGQGQPALRPTTRPLEVPEGPSKVQVLGENADGWRGRRKRLAIRDAYLYRIYHARKRVWIANSYFMPDPVVLRALTRAGRRGVDVRIVLPGVSDIPAVKWAGRATYSRLLRAGVRVFEWDHNVMHAKSAVVDSHWTTIGSYNLDYRSFRYNLEVNVAIDDERFAEAVEASLEADQRASREIVREVWANRPIAARFLERFCYWCRALL